MTDNKRLLINNLVLIALLINEIAVTIYGAASLATGIAITMVFVGLAVFAVSPYEGNFVLLVVPTFYAVAFVGFCVVDAEDPSTAPIVGVGLGVFALIVQVWITVREMVDHA